MPVLSVAARGCCVTAKGAVSFWVLLQNASSGPWKMHFGLSDLCKNQSQFLLVVAIYMICRNHNKKQ